MLTQTLQPRSTQARDRVLEAACHLFATHGYQAIGLRDLAKHLGMQAGSLYHHIESKQSLLFELIECSLTDLIYETRQAIKRSRTPAERLQTFVQAFVSFSQENPDHLILMTREAVNLDDDQSRQIQGLQATYTELLANIVADECGCRLAIRGSYPLLMRLFACCADKLTGVHQGVLQALCLKCWSALFEA